MCGILGLISRSANKDLFLSGLKGFSYRGPDNTGLFNDPYILFGHNRLSIIDLDERSNQPFFSADKRYVIILNGEIYNYLTLKKELEKVGFLFKTSSDTEVALYGYIYWGAEAFIKFHGMFALAVYDTHTGDVVIARDRMGEKPLFYYYKNENFCFSSEIKGINHLYPDLNVDQNALIDYLSFGYIPAPKTIYHEIKKLEPGTFIRLNVKNPSEFTIKNYYNLKINPCDKNYSFSEKAEEFEDILTRVSNEITISDVPIGTFLSGGVDSSAVAAVLKEKNPRLRAFTIGFDEEKYNEIPYAKKVAGHLNIKHITRKVTMPDVEAVYHQMVRLYDEPYNDFSFIPTYYVCKEAKAFSTVVVSGDGADEIFCGYDKYFRIQKFHQLRQKSGSAFKLISHLHNMLPDQSDYKRQVRRMGMTNQELLHDLSAMVFKPYELKNYAGSYLKNGLKNYSSIEVIKGHLKGMDNMSLLQQMRYLDIKMLLPDDMLVKVDRASMYNSLEVRAFFLHPLIVEFALSLPENLLVSNGQNKYFLKKFFEKHLPHDILYRKKMGFVPPFKHWLDNELKALLNKALEAIPQEIINQEEVKKLLHLQSKQQRDFTPQLHSLLFLGTWIKENNITF
jgi:asparagine synthase (glutamine-hydrolysing)